MRRETLMFAATVGVALLTAAGCSRQSQPAPEERRAPKEIVEAVTSVDRGGISGMDRELLAQVRRLVPKNVRVSAVGGVVTLSGLVASIDERDTFAARAGQVAGVRKVENALEVVGEPPEGEPDTE